MGETISFLVIIGLAVIIIFFSFNTLSMKREVDKLKEQCSNNEKMIDEITDYNSLLEEYKRARDLVNINALDEYRVFKYTKNILLDNALSYKIYQAENTGIKVNFECSRPISWKMDEADTVALVFNLMDNAIEAACKCENPFINISIKDGEAFIMNIENSKRVDWKANENEVGGTLNSTGNLKSDNTISPAYEKGATSKADTRAHGFGIGVVKKLVDKYKGSVMFCDLGGSFRVELVL